MPVRERGEEGDEKRSGHSGIAGVRADEHGRGCLHHRWESVRLGCDSVLAVRAEPILDPSKLLRDGVLSLPIRDRLDNGLLIDVAETVMACQGIMRGG